MLSLIVLLILVGIFAGTIGSMVGLGGGVIIVPVLLFLGSIYGEIDITPQIAVGTSLVVVGVSSLSSSISYFKKGRVDASSAWLFFAASGPAAILGAYLNSLMSGGAFMLGFGLFMIAVSFLLMMRGKWTQKKLRWTVTRTYRDPVSEESYTYGYTRTIALIASFVVGMLAGLFGVGGGALMMPVLLLLFHFPVHLAAATSMFMIFLSSIPGSVTHAYLGSIDWLLAVAIAPGAWVGGKLGSWLSLKMKGKTLVFVLRMMLILTGVKLIWDGVQAL